MFKKYRYWIYSLLLVFFIPKALDFLFPLSGLYPPYSSVYLDRSGRVLRIFLARDQMWRIRLQDDEVSPYLRQTVLLYEDRYFYYHPGINPVAVVRAAFVNLRAGRVKQGASTITMQVARLIQPKSRTLLNKMLEVFRAFQLEWHYSKDEILAMYFNMAPYGGNIVGAEAAAYIYFGKSNRQFSRGEAAILTLIPQNPLKNCPSHDPERIRTLRDQLLERLDRSGLITPEEKRESQSEPIPADKRRMPFMIPHLSNRLNRLQQNQDRVETTIDLDIQLTAQQILQSRLSPLLSQHITNGAVVVIENISHHVMALVGSHDYFDRENQGQVNGANALRSPGSALKPFVYALALEQGFISPLSRIPDIPVSYGGYEPENYDGIYHGLVTTEEALSRSLNVPAVGLAAQVGYGNLYDFLKNAGLTSLNRSKDYYGLSLILGGCEVKLLELTNLYSGLANGGIFQEAVFVKNRPPTQSCKLLKPGTCYILSEILSQVRRPELPAVWESGVNLAKVAWKTGTSYGNKDAWSIGYTPRYTVGVWIGNFDGRGVSGMTGADMAGPVMFDLINQLEKNTDKRWFLPPDDVHIRQVCTKSGMPRSEYCASTSQELYLPGISPNHVCTVHKSYMIDQKNGFRLCSHCRQNRAYDEKVFEEWPAEVAVWMERNGYRMDRIPEHWPHCSRIVGGSAPVIRFPANNCQFKIRPNVNLKYQRILLDASVSNQTRKIFWFLNGKLLFAGSPIEKFFWEPRPGTHTLVCVDDEGRSSEIIITIN